MGILPPAPEEQTWSRGFRSAHALRAPHCPCHAVEPPVSRRAFRWLKCYHSSNCLDSFRNILHGAISKVRPDGPVGSIVSAAVPGEPDPLGERSRASYQRKHRIIWGHHTCWRLAFVRTPARRFAFRFRPGLHSLRAQVNATIPALAHIIMMRHVWNHHSRKPCHTAMVHRHHTTVKEKLRMVSRLR